MAECLLPAAKEHGWVFERKPVPIPTHWSLVGPFLAFRIQAQLWAWPGPSAPPTLGDQQYHASAGDKLPCLDGAASWPHEPGTCSPVSKQPLECFILITFETGNQG